MRNNLKNKDINFIKYGFTLIELLAVIVILAIIALIAIPLIGNVIEKAKIGALENSVNGLVESANMYYANQSIKGEQAIETVFDFANGEQTSTEKLEYKGKVYNGKLILHANGEIAVCIDDKEHYAYKNKDSDEIVSGIGTCVYDGTTGDFSSNSSIKDLRGKTVVATNVTQSADGLSTLITIPEEGHYDTNSIISILNSNLNNYVQLFIGDNGAAVPYSVTNIYELPSSIGTYTTSGSRTTQICNIDLNNNYDYYLFKYFGTYHIIPIDTTVTLWYQNGNSSSPKYGVKITTTSNSISFENVAGCSDSVMPNVNSIYACTGEILNRID